MAILKQPVIHYIENNLIAYHRGTLTDTRWKKIIEQVLVDERMDDIKEGIIKLGYFKGLKVEDLVEEIFISRRYYFEKKKELLLLIALYALSEKCLIVEGGEIDIYSKMHH